MPRRRATAAEYRRCLLRAQLLVQERLNEDVDVASLAAAAHFSMHHFHRIFHAQMGETVMQYVRRLRLERAARKIRSAEVRLLDVALAAGYASHEAFTRAFVDRFGLPPSHFREQRRDRITARKPERNTLPTVEARVETHPPVRVVLMLAAIPAGTYAVGVHVGPYDRLHETYLDVIGRWFPQSGYELAPDAVVEHYLNDPTCTPATELRTEVRERSAE